MDDASTMGTVGLISPGKMGASVGALLSPGRTIYWASEGRGPASLDRARRAGLTDAGDLRTLARESHVILSICPPGAAETVARDVARLGFVGTYVDANPIAPRTSRDLAAMLGEEVDYVDGCIVGPPVQPGSGTRFYVVGTASGVMAELFAHSALEVVQLEGGVGAASALKICYGTTTKGIAGLLLGVRALATAEGVDAALVAEWKKSAPHLLAQADAAVAQNAARAWRVVDELEQGAEAFREVGLPEGFSTAGAEIMRRMRDFKDAPGPIEPSEVVERILEP